MVATLDPMLDVHFPSLPIHSLLNVFLVQGSRAKLFQGLLQGRTGKLTAMTRCWWAAKHSLLDRLAQQEPSERKESSSRQEVHRSLPCGLHWSQQPDAGRSATANALGGFLHYRNNLQEMLQALTSRN
jgi:hypothetical protein